MPSKSKSQHNLMAAVAHSPSFAKKVGIKQSVGKEFMSADKGKKFSKGGTMAKMKHDDIVEDKKMIKKAVGMHDKQLHGGKKTNLSALKKGGCVKKMAAGGKAKGTDVKIAMMKKEAPKKPAMQAPMPPAMQQRPPMAAQGAPMMCGGGKVKKMAGGGLAAGHKSADGVATKGKTKGKEITMARGGATKKRYC